MRESRTLEYKRTLSATYLKTVSAYANYRTGEIKFGIDDQGIAVGIENPYEACLSIENKINDSISPKPDFTLDVNKRTGVITLTVKEGLHKPYFYKSKAYCRNDAATVEVDTLELTRLILEGQNKSFESLKSQKQDLSFRHLERALQTTLQIQALSKDILKTLELYSDNEGFNQAAALLADENAFFGIDIVRFGETINILQYRETIEHVSILQQFDKAMVLFRMYYQYEEVRETRRDVVEMIPAEAFREAVANALVHRTWDVGAHIRISMYPDRIEIVSPGGLPKGISKEEYLDGQVSLLRNPIIGNVFFRLNLIERFGTGVKRIQHAYTDSDRKPQFSVFENSISVTLPLIQRASSLPAEERLICEALSGNKRLSSSEIAKVTGLSKYKAISLLKSLQAQGLVKSVGAGRGTKYLI